MFYQPRVYSQMTQPQAQRQSAQNPLRSTITTTFVPPQPVNPLSSVSDVVGMYKIGKGGMELFNDASRLYDRWTMPMGENSAGIVSEMVGPGMGKVNMSPSFLSGGAFTPGAMTPEAADAAAFLGGYTPEAGGYGLLSTSATASPLLERAATEAAMTPLMENVGMTGAEMLGASAVPEAVAAGGQAATEAGVLGSLGAESALGLLGPVGMAASLGLGLTKLFGLW